MRSRTGFGWGLEEATIKGGQQIYYPIKLGLLIALLLISISLAACAQYTPESGVPLTAEVLKNAVYQSEWPEGGVTQLSDGEYRKPIVEGSATELIIRLADMTFGNLDSDGVEDAAVILITDPGGSGTFYELAAVLNRNGEPEHVATASLGDRAGIRAFSIKAGQIIIEMVTHGSEDPMCCPTQIVRNTHTLEDNALVETTSELVGTVQESSEGAISPEVLGILWQWREFVETEAASQSLVQQPENFTLVFQPDGTLAIQADCNRVSGSYTLDGNVFAIALGPATMAFCGEESLNQQFLELLGIVDSYAIEEGRLLLILKDNAGRMTFDKN